MTSGKTSMTGETEMASVKLQISSRDDTKNNFLRAMNGESIGAVISFETPEDLFKALAGKRWQLLKTLTGAGPVSIREAARRVGRDVKAVHSDIHALLDVGILEKNSDGLILFPYDSIHVDFVLQAA